MTKTTWDYTELAAAYEHRPPYAPEAIDAIVSTAMLQPDDPTCDVGAGTGHLAVELLARGLRVAAVEPNDAMRGRGETRTARHPGVTWHAGTGEDTGLPGAQYRVVTFGSSFNVVDQSRALAEAHRLLRPDGWFACLWNHRDITDPLQRRIEAVIRGAIPDYSYGSRREDPAPIIAASGLFSAPRRYEAGVRHTMSSATFADGWHSHGTLQRQAGPRFEELVSRIRDVIAGEGDQITVPYTTRLWMASRRP